MSGLRLSVVVLIVVATTGAGAQESGVDYKSWSLERAEVIARSTRVNGRVGGVWDLRVLRTERSYNYKLRATLMTPEVTRATARLAQLSDGLTDAETEALVTEAEKPGALIIMFEIDPREGSGIVPPEMVVLLRPKGDADVEAASVRGVLTPSLRNVRALAGAYRRDYAYEQFWAVFAIDDERGRRLRAREVMELELVVRIYDKEGRVSWRVPEAFRR